MSQVSTREKILEAADELFGELGFDATSTRLIGERSGLNKALIHYHFKNKDALFHAVLDRYYARLGEVLRELLGGAGGGGLRERMAHTLDAYVDFLAANHRFCHMVQREVAVHRHLGPIVGHMAPMLRVGASLIRAQHPATAGGELAAEQLLVSFYGMIVSTFTYAPVLEQLLGSDPLAQDALAARKRHLRRMLDLVLDTLEREG